MQTEPYVRRANYYETDQMGIVHHSNFFRYFEEARLDYMRQTQCDALELEKMGIIIPNLDAYAKYIRVLRCGDLFTVRVKPVSFTGAKMKFEYDVVRDGEICCSGFTTHCFVDAQMKPLLLRRAFPEVYARITAVFPGN